MASSETIAGVTLRWPVGRTGQATAEPATRPSRTEDNVLRLPRLRGEVRTFLWRSARFSASCPMRWSWRTPSGLLEKTIVAGHSGKPIGSFSNVVLVVRLPSMIQLNADARCQRRHRWPGWPLDRKSIFFRRNSGDVCRLFFFIYCVLDILYVSADRFVGTKLRSQGGLRAH